MLSLSNFSAANTTIELWTYYTFPPFTTDQGQQQGLSFDFAGLLNQQNSGLTFETRYLPRPRINAYLDEQEDAVILWVNPIWFGDADRKKYRWTAPVIQDRNEVISHADKKLEFTGPESLFGLKLGTTRGHKYKNLDAHIQSGEIKGEEAVKEEANLKKLIAGRIDATIMPTSGAAYLINRDGLHGKLYMSSAPHQEYARHILIRAKDKNTEEKIANAINRAMSSDGWKALLEKYSLQ